MGPSLSPSARQDCIGQLSYSLWRRLCTRLDPADESAEFRRKGTGSPIGGRRVAEDAVQRVASAARQDEEVQRQGEIALLAAVQFGSRKIARAHEEVQVLEVTGGRDGGGVDR